MFVVSYGESILLSIGKLLQFVEVPLQMLPMHLYVHFSDRNIAIVYSHIQHIVFLDHKI